MSLSYIYIYIYVCVCVCVCWTVSCATSKLIGDKKDTFKSFMVFDIIPRGLVFKVVVGSQIVVSPTIPPLQ